MSGYTAPMSSKLYEMLGIALVVGCIGPLFWLGVNVLENKLKALLSKEAAKRKARRAADELSRPRRIS